MVNLETILSWFQTGDYPTQEEFEQTFSSFRHKDTKIPITEVDGLESSLNNKLNVDDLPSNMALVDDGQPSDVFNKEQIMAMAMMLSDYVKDGKIRADKIEALGLTDLIESNERNIAEFAANSGKYEFQQNDFIAVPDDKGNFSLFIFKGEEKSDTKNYLPTGLTNITMSMVEGLQSALNTKLDKPAVNGNYFVRMNGTASYQAINPGSDHLLFWNGSEFKNSNIFRESSGLKYGIGTTTPAEQLHLTSRARMSGLVLENNTETLPQQLTYSSKKFFGTDDAGMKRPLMYSDYEDYLTLINELTDVQKATVRTAMNGGYVQNGSISIFSYDTVVINKSNGINYLTLFGAGLNFNPADFEIKIITSTSTVNNMSSVFDIPSSQVILNTIGNSITFWTDFTNIPLGDYKIFLRNGVAQYITGINFDVVDSLTEIPLVNVWRFLNADYTTTNPYLVVSDKSISYRLDSDTFPPTNNSTICSTATTKPIVHMGQNFTIELSQYYGTYATSGRMNNGFGFYIGGDNDSANIINNLLWGAYYIDGNTSVNILTTPFGHIAIPMHSTIRLLVSKRANFMSITLITSSSSYSTTISVDVDSNKYIYFKGLYFRDSQIAETTINITKATINK